MHSATKVSILAMFSAAIAAAGPLSVSVSQNGLSYSALFENIGAGQLQITVDNTGVTAPTDEGGVIGALFFSLAGDPTLSPVSMSLPNGSIIVNGSGDPAPHWEYARGLAAPGGATQGVSAAGYGLFGTGNFCSGVNCGTQVQGIDWGIVNAAYTPGSGNSSISGQALIRHTAVFVLSGVPVDFDPSTGVTNVSAQYTASLTGANLSANSGFNTSAVPEPASYGFTGIGLILAAGLGRKRVRGSKK